jgi:hypothetical protein
MSWNLPGLLITGWDVLELLPGSLDWMSWNLPGLLITGWDVLELLPGSLAWMSWNLPGLLITGWDVLESARCTAHEATTWASADCLSLMWDLSLAKCTLSDVDCTLYSSGHVVHF